MRTHKQNALLGLLQLVEKYKGFLSGETHGSPYGNCPLCKITDGCKACPNGYTAEGKEHTSCGDKQKTLMVLKNYTFDLHASMYDNLGKLTPEARKVLNARIRAVKHMHKVLSKLPPIRFQPSKHRGFPEMWKNYKL